MKVPINFFMTVNASSKKTQTSKRISFPFRIRRVRVHFPIGSELNLPVSIILSNDPTIPTTAAPDGVNILQSLGGYPTIQGNDETFDINLDMKVRERGKYIKVYGENKDATNGHYVYGIVEIESLGGK